MSKHTPIIAVAAFLLITLGVVYLAVWKSGSRQEPGQVVTPPGAKVETPTEGAKPKPPGMSIEGGAIEQRNAQGHLEWKVNVGGELEFDKDRQMVTGQDVQFEMVQEGRLPVIVVAPVFHADYATRKLTFDQGVKGHLKDNSAHFQVNHLVYDFTTKKLIGTGGAQFVQGQNSATAREIVLDAVAKKVRMRGSVRFEHHG